MTPRFSDVDVPPMDTSDGRGEGVEIGSRRWQRPFGAVVEPTDPHREYPRPSLVSVDVPLSDGPRAGMAQEGNGRYAGQSMTVRPGLKGSRPDVIERGARA